MCLQAGRATDEATDEGEAGPVQLLLRPQHRQTVRPGRDVHIHRERTHT